MDLKTKLIDFLTQLPEVDDPDRRKGLVASTGFSHLGVHLNWQGDNNAFFQQLLQAFGARGKEALVQFLGQLPDLAGLAAEHKEQAAELQREVQALGADAWQQQFSVGAPPAEQATAPDSGMLAMSLVSTVLTPYFKLGAEELRRQGDTGAVRLAERVWQKVHGAFAGDEASADLVDFYRQMPEATQTRFTARLNEKLAASPALARELSALLAKTDDEDEAALRRLINIAQNAGTVKGEMVGVIFGKAALPQGTTVDVEQEIDTVGEGGAVVGAVLGGDGPLHVGGQQHYGDRVEGDKQEIDTDGGAYIGGSLTAGGDFVGRDKITTGDISGSGIAIGSGAQASVSIQQGLSGAELERLFNPLIAAAQQAPHEEREQALQTVQAIQEEAAKGENADDSRMAGLIEDLVEAAPSLIETVVGLFSNTVLARIAGGTTNYVLGRLRRRLK